MVVQTTLASKAIFKVLIWVIRLEQQFFSNDAQYKNDDHGDQSDDDIALDPHSAHQAQLSGSKLAWAIWVNRFSHSEKHFPSGQFRNPSGAR